MNSTISRLQNLIDDPHHWIHGRAFALRCLTNQELSDKLDELNGQMVSLARKGKPRYQVTVEWREHSNEMLMRNLCEAVRDENGGVDYRVEMHCAMATLEQGIVETRRALISAATLETNKTSMFVAALTKLA